MSDLTKRLIKYATSTRLNRLTAVAAAAALLLAPAPADAANSNEMRCVERTLSVRLAEDGAANFQLWGELCRPGGAPPATVQVLLHGGTSNHNYWDFPYADGQLSYVKAAVHAGFATFNVDRIGVGRSSHPPAADVSIAGEAVAVHDVITALRAGSVDGHRYQRVILAGHSFGAAVGISEAARFEDVDAFIDAGFVHAVTDAFAAEVQVAIHPADEDPMFAGRGYTDYVTTVPGTRAGLYHDPRTSNPRIDAIAEATKDVQPANELAEIFAFAKPPTPADAASRAVTAPVLIVMGTADRLFCGSGAFDCSDTAAIQAYEDEYWTTGVRYQFVPATGHMLQESLTAPSTAAAMLAWARNPR